MQRFVFVTLVVAAIGIATAQTRSTRGSELTGAQQRQFSESDDLNTHAFSGTWQGLGHNYRAATHTEKGSQTSLSVTLTVRAAADGTFSGTVSTSNFQRQPTPESNPPLTLGAPPRPAAPPPPPLPAVPPAGKFLNPRVAGHTLAFQVKDDDGKLVDFRLTIQAPDAATVNVTRYSAVYPEFQMKRVQ